MPHPIRLQLSRAPGFDLQTASHAANGLAAVKVDRTTIWGNPFTVGPCPAKIRSPGGSKHAAIPVATLDESLTRYRRGLMRGLG